VFQLRERVNTLPSVVRVLLSLALVVVVVVAVLTLGLMLMESRMIYYPARALDTTPAARGWAFEDLRLEASDGVGIHGWFIPAPPGASAAAPTVLFLHGNAGNVSHRLEKLAILRDLGAAVLIVDYRGYGQSGGSPHERGLYRDARAAYDHLARQRGIEPGAIVLYGESLGSAVAMQLAAEVPVGGVVLEAAFTSIADVGQAMYPFLPVRWVVRHRFDTLAKVPRTRAPLLILHGRGDEFFPLRHAERLAAAAGSRARLVVLRGSHNEAFLQDESTYRRALGEFLAERARALAL
jgi:uncharacterized protein